MMKLVHFRQSLKLPILKAFIAFLLTIVLAACGTNAATTSSTAGLHPSSTAIKSANTSLDFNPENINIKAGNLLIQSPAGFQCPYSLTQSLGTPPRKQLVFASNRTTYTQAEIEQMRAYLTYYMLPTYYLERNKEPNFPSTLREMLGGETDNIHDFPLGKRDRKCVV
jgi:hypothetical protein